MLCQKQSRCWRGQLALYLSLLIAPSWHLPRWHHMSLPHDDAWCLYRYLCDFFIYVITLLHEISTKSSLLWMYCEMVQQCVYIYIRSVAKVSDWDRKQCSQHSIAILHVLDAYMHKYMHTWTCYRTFLRLFVAWLHKSSERISIHASPSASVQRKMMKFQDITSHQCHKNTHMQWEIDFII